MARLRKRGEQIRQYILDSVGEHPTDIVQLTAQTFDISRQAVNKHIQYLIGQGCLQATGATSRRCYSLATTEKCTHSYVLDGLLEEDQVWRHDVAAFLGQLPDNVMNIWHYGFTEIFNNAIDHSSGTRIAVHMTKTAISSEIIVHDDGEGIFQKIQKALNLYDERQAVLELAKGKLTTDPARHTGEGIFFSSRMFDEFTILSGGVYFSHEFGDNEDWILEMEPFKSGTAVFMKINNHTERTVKAVFDQFAGPDDYGFTKTIVPVRLAQYGDELLISRSQAKRLLARIDKFKTVIFDFSGVAAIGQAFADEIFRVFANQHPNIEMLPLNAAPEVLQMIMRAKAHH
jgi:anti-sigma regulatory factor (Ser/Thr protein kinase)